MVRLRHLKQALELATTAAVLCAALVIVWKMALAPSTQKTSEPVEDVGNLVLDAKSISNPLGVGKVAIVEFSDFQCPFCAKYASETWPDVKREFVDSGQATYIAMQYPLTRIHPLALQASQAAECAGRQGKFWEMHHLLFKSKALAPAELAAHAVQLGLENEAFKVCLEQEQTRPKVEADLKEGLRLGVKGTPMFFIGQVQSDGSVRLSRRIRGVVSLDMLRLEVKNAMSRSDDAKVVTVAE